MIPVYYYLLLSAALFSIGLLGALSKKNAILVLMSIELMLSATGINLVAFSHYLSPEAPAFLRGQVFALFVMVIAASEAGLGLAIILLLFRMKKTITVDKFNLLKG